MNIAIIGAGITGLTAAYRLSQKGEMVTVFEKEGIAGGLSAGFKKENWHWSCENFFHHFFTSDVVAKKLIFDLGLSDKLFFTRPKTSIFYQNKISQFDSPFSVIKFPYLSYLEKIRTAGITAYLKSTSNWKNYEKTTAEEWLKKYYGQNPYRILWEPLLESKFGNEAQKISMSWFWARIKKRSARLGYLQGGFQTLIGELVKKIKDNQGKIILNSEIKKLTDINNNRNFNRIIVTTSSQSFLKMAPDLPRNYQTKLKKLKMFGAINLILILKEKFLTDGTYWLNINEPKFPFVAVVEHTNFVSPKYYDGYHILYVGGYYPQNHRFFKMSKQRILKEFLPYLQKINPFFDFQSHLVDSLLFGNLFAQPVVPIDYSKLIPLFQTPISNVYLANMQMVYPWDRGTNYAIELGEEIAKKAVLA